MCMVTELQYNNLYGWYEKAEFTYSSMKNQCINKYPLIPFKVVYIKLLNSL